MLRNHSKVTEMLLFLQSRASSFWHTIPTYSSGVDSDSIYRSQGRDLSRDLQEKNSFWQASNVTCLPKIKTCVFVAKNVGYLLRENSENVVGLAGPMSHFWYPAPV